jgi:hypothetical protein
MSFEAKRIKEKKGKEMRGIFSHRDRGEGKSFSYGIKIKLNFSALKSARIFSVLLCIGAIECYYD